MNELDKYKKQNPFIVPDGFFDALRDEVMETVRKEEKRRLFRRRVAFVSSAAAVLVIVLMVSIFWKPSTGELVAIAPEKTKTETQTIMQMPADIEEIVETPAAKNVSSPTQNRFLAQSQKSASPKMVSSVATANVEVERNGEITSSIMEEYTEELEQELYCDALLDLDLYLDLCYEY